MSLDNSGFLKMAKKSYLALLFPFNHTFQEVLFQILQQKFTFVKNRKSHLVQTMKHNHMARHTKYWQANLQMLMKLNFCV